MAGLDQVVNFAVGETIYREGDPSDAVYVIEAGIVEMVRMHAGAVTRLGVLRRGEIFGETGVIRDRPRSATARARTAVSLLRISRPRFLEVFAPDNPIALPLLRMLCDRLADANRRLAALETDTSGAAREEAGSIRLLSASPVVEAQIGREGLAIAQLPFTVGRRARLGDGPRANSRELLLGVSDEHHLSPLHWAIDAIGGVLVVRDLGSALGTVVNGKRVADFEDARWCALRFGLNDIVAGGLDSPYHFGVLVERR